MCGKITNIVVRDGCTKMTFKLKTERARSVQERGRLREPELKKYGQTVWLFFQKHKGEQHKVWF